MAYYFAYGSNMNTARVMARIGETRRALAGRLVDHELRFDKASRIPGIAHANVVPSVGDNVEGVLFELIEPSQIELMDPFEGVPREYCRELRGIETGEGTIEAWVYFAVEGSTRPELRPAREYLEHLLAGKPYLSEKYHAQLAQVETVSGLCDTTLSALGLSRFSAR